MQQEDESSLGGRALEFYWASIMVFVVPAVVVALGLGYAAWSRYLSHKERIALIEKGIVPDDMEQEGQAQSRQSSLTTGVILAMIGAALTLGMLTIGIGPWLIAGLVPMGIGSALIILYLLTPRNSEEDENHGQ